jgi:hypothetical protein
MLTERDVTDGLGANVGKRDDEEDYNPHLLYFNLADCLANDWSGTAARVLALAEIAREPNMPRGAGFSVPDAECLPASVIVPVKGTDEGLAANLRAVG